MITPLGIEIQERAVLTIDVLGFTQLVEKEGTEGTIHFLDKLYRRAEASILPHGEIVKFIGDSVLAHFADAENALLAADSLSESLPDIPHAIGLDFGEIGIAPIGLNGAKDIFGSAVNGAFIVGKNAGINATGAFLTELGDDKRNSWSSNDGQTYLRVEVPRTS